MSDTPRTDNLLTAILDAHGFVHKHNCPPQWVSFARELERELNAANERIELLTACNADVARIAKERDDALERIKRLEEAGDEMARWLSSPRNIGGDRLMAAEWDKAKEAKP
jgi:hypothetical protein